MFVSHLERDIESSVAVIYLRHRCPLQQCLDIGCKLRHGDSILCQQGCTRTDSELRALHLLLNVEVGNTFDILYGITYLIANGIHAVEIGAKEFDGNTGTRSRQHGIDTMTDRRPYLHINSRNLRQTMAHIIEQFVLCAVG